MTQYNEFPNIIKRISDLNRRVRDQETAPRLYSVGIGSGGIRIYGGGSLNIREGGDINIQEGGDINVGSGGSINILNSGQILSEGPAQFTGSAQLKGDTIIDGNLSIRNNVTFPDGKLEGAFLKNQFQSTYVQRQNVSYSGNFTGDRNVITQTVSVPVWATNMIVFMAGVAKTNSPGAGGTRGFVVKVFVDTQESSGGLMTIVAPDGMNTIADGAINSIKQVNVTNKTSVTMGTLCYHPATSGSGTASFYATIVFVR